MGLDSYAKEFVLYVLCQGNPPGASNTDVNRRGFQNALAAVKDAGGRQARMLGCSQPRGTRQ